ncbi:MAG: CBS domain-containing protein [Deltaproteobacteria bacterium]|nr:MAG: CBS domain-containing protein [Deltaproteobacteria bacterium]
MPDARTQGREPPEELPDDCTEEAERNYSRRQAPVLFGFRLPLGRQATMLLMGLLIGVAGGFGAIAFRWLITTCQDLAWGPGDTALGRIEAASPLMVLLVPALGGVLVGVITRYMAPEAKGHGVPEVMYAVARKGGVIRPVVVIGKALASAVCIATGGSVGREGPIVQIGAAMGSTLGRLFRLPVNAVRMSVACGAAAGIAGTFNAPIAGAFFALEVILGNFSSNAFGAVVISSVTATAITRSVLGNEPAFQVPAYSIHSPWEMWIYAVLGLLAAGAAILYVLGIEWFEDRFDALDRVPVMLRPAVGGLIIGFVGLFLPQIMGVGYDTIQPMLAGEVGLGMLLVLLVAKMLGTGLTIGSGGSGGVFAPSLFIGAALGGLVGGIAGHLVSFPIGSPGAYALVGMGAMVAAATHAPITAILIIFELTNDYHVILGLMVSCIIGTLVSQRVLKQSIYTMKLARRGIDLKEGQEVNVLRSVQVRDIMRHDMEIVQEQTTFAQLVDRMVLSPHYEFLVVDDDGRLVGIISVDDIRHALPRLSTQGEEFVAADLMSRRPITVRETDTLDRVMRCIARRTYEEIPVLPADGEPRPIGVIRRDDVIRAYNKQMLRADLGGSVSARMSDSTQQRLWAAIGPHVLGQVEVPEVLNGRTLASLHLPARHGVEVILIEHPERPDDSRYELPRGETVLETGQRMLLFGERSKVERLLEQWT